MAHDRADFKPMPVLPIDSDGSQPDILEVEDAAVPAQQHPSMGAIGKILALNEEGWDIDDQVRTLKTAAERAPPSRPVQHSGATRRIDRRRSSAEVLHDRVVTG